MLVRKCDVCGHIIGDEAGYMVDISRTSMPKGEEVRIKTQDITIEICFDCEQAMLDVLNERMTKYVIMGKEQENKE